MMNQEGRGRRAATHQYKGKIWLRELGSYARGRDWRYYRRAAFKLALLGHFGALEPNWADAISDLAREVRLCCCGWSG